MEYCKQCGRQLIEKELEHEGIVPYCETCQTFRFPQYNVAMSAIVYDENEEKILLIKQYGQPQNILVAGYVSYGEELETAVRREIQEETGLEAAEMRFNSSLFYEKNSVLMVNFACRVKDKSALSCNHEIDEGNWFTAEEVKAAIYPNSLAQQFLFTWLEKGCSLAD